MKVALNLDDFSVVNNRLDLLLRLKAVFPSFKVSMFTIPMDTKMDVGPYLIRKELLQEVKKHLDWIQIIPHGYMHHGSEMKNMNVADMAQTLTHIEEAFNRDGLPFERGFKSPHWRTSPEVVHALDMGGWWMAIDPRQPGMPTTKTFYRYSDPLDNIDYSKGTLKLHGHIYGTKNDLGACMENLLKLPQDTEWHYVTDFLETL